jgi:hypothetical protein
VVDIRITWIIKVFSIETNFIELIKIKKNRLIKESLIKSTECPEELENLSIFFLF